MKINIKKDAGFVEYDIDNKALTLLEALTHIKTKIDKSLAFSSGCRSSICGSCAMRVNGREVLACSYRLQEDDKVEPLKNMPLLRDLMVDMDSAYAFNAKAKAWLVNKSSVQALNHEDEQINELQSDCILCGACYSACPVYALKPDFLGPFSLTRVWKYVSDKREDGEAQKIEDIQSNGVWDCTLCNECTLVCPQDISSKADIEKLRMKSAQYGFMDPSFASFGGGFGSFDGSPSF